MRASILARNYFSAVNRTIKQKAGS